MAALSVVHRRLVQVGLGDICLELHSRSARKKTVLDELGRTLAASAGPPRPAPAAALTEVRDRLNGIDELLHAAVGNTGESAYSVLARQARFLGIGAPSPTLDGSALAALSRSDEQRLCAAVDGLATVLGRLGPPDRHPFSGLSADLDPVELDRLRGTAARAAPALAALRAAVDLALGALGAPGQRPLAAVAPVLDTLGRLTGLAPADGELAHRLLGAADLPRVAAALREAAEWAAARSEAAESFTPAAFGTPAAPLVAALAGGRSFFGRWGGRYRAASATLATLLSTPLP